jgi:CRP-like cAMP-binding protein
LAEQNSIVSLPSLDERFDQRLRRSSKYIRIKKGDPLQDPLHNFYILISGKIKIYQLNIDNLKELTISLLTAGDMFDVIPLLDGKNHDVISEALEESHLLEVPIDSVREMIDEEPTFRKFLFLYIAKQLRQSEELASDLALHSTSQRLIKLILQKSKLLEGLSREEIAKLIGTVRQVLDRHIHELKERGAIATGRNRIEIKDIQKILENFEKI